MESRGVAFKLRLVDEFLGRALRRNEFESGRLAHCAEFALDGIESDLDPVGGSFVNTDAAEIGQSELAAVAVDEPIGGTGQPGGELRKSGRADVNPVVEGKIDRRDRREIFDFGGQESLFFLHAIPGTDRRPRAEDASQLHDEPGQLGLAQIAPRGRDELLHPRGVDESVGRISVAFALIPQQARAGLSSGTDGQKHRAVKRSAAEMFLAGTPLGHAGAAVGGADEALGYAAGALEHVAGEKEAGADPLGGGPPKSFAELGRALRGGVGGVRRLGEDVERLGRLAPLAAHGEGADEGMRLCRAGHVAATFHVALAG